MGNEKVKTTYIPTNLNKFTFISPRMKEWVENKCKGEVLNLFAGKTVLDMNEYRVDVDRKMIAHYYGDAYEYAKNCKKRYDTVLLDPPYAYRKAMEMYNGSLFK